ncbi:hypothetical protein BCON_0117g00170 [Botryotinia convoluta]|uniref:Uncharacterized protein n=1 Tax=Botryotinia convoluta TaxID=54673 RepID=A0A4Z1HYY0_9HELO|nr:hypothetical protein BCON_0117g00170 [Botryotinia convoluta]
MDNMIYFDAIDTAAAFNKFVQDHWRSCGFPGPLGIRPGPYEREGFLIPGPFGLVALPRPSSSPSQKEAQQEAKERSIEVLSQWNRLRQILERHEDLIRKRWMKRSKVSRSRIILQIWPGLPATHRPDLQSLIAERYKLKKEDTKFRDAYLWPHLNIEDLLGRFNSAIPLAFLNLHFMELDGETIETYGRLVPWLDDADARTRLFAGLAHLPGAGLLILEMQQRLLHLLVKCCEALLHDFSADGLINESLIKPEPPLLTDNPRWASIAAVAAEAPYRLALKIDFNRLKIIVEGRRISAEDHIRDLREDPGYFAEFLGEWSEHRPEKLLDILGNQHSSLDKPLFWELVIENVVSDAYGALVTWGEYRSANYQNSFLEDGPIKNLKMAVPASPPHRSKFVRKPQVSGSSSIQVCSRKPEDEMMWLFSSLWTDRNHSRITLNVLVDAIEYRIERDSSEKAKVSALVTRFSSDLGLISHIYHKLEIYFPWACSYGYQSDFRGPLSLSVGKRRNEQNTESMRKAEYNLDGFWQKMDEVYQRNTGQTLTQAVKHICTVVRPLEWTPEWVEAIKVPKTKPQERTGRDEASPIPQFDSDDTIKFIAPQPKSKPKTRGPAITTESPTTLAAAEAAPTPTPDSQPTFKLKARAIKVFEVLFWQPSLNDLPGEIPRADFLYAMTSTGFAAEKQYGSVWQFTPTKLDVERSIQFHEPHPSGKIAFRTARRMGRRLGR